MSDSSDLVIPSLPTITGNGLFSVNVVVPNADSSFNPTPSNPSTSYSYPLQDPALLIGSGSQPYMPVALPAYITTLYNNVYNINTNLQNDISTSAPDDRTYPTSYAVQQYVQSQIAGTQVINGSQSGNTYLVTTTVNNTLITAATPGTGYTYFNASLNKSCPISVFWMDTTPDAPRNGASKTVMFADAGYLTDSNGVTGGLAFLYAGDSSYFINMGQQYKYYQFVYTGDFISFIQAYDGSKWDWLVTGSMGVFTNSVSISQGQNIAVSANSQLPLPANGSLGGLTA